MHVLQSLLRALRPPALRHPQLRSRHPPPTNPCQPSQARRSSTKPSPSNNPTPTANANANAKTTTRIETLLSRLPRPLQKYTSRLRGAPVTHVAAFLVLHEITAVIPLLGLFGLFHYTDYVPVSYMLAHYGGYVKEGVRRFERWFRRRGWFGFGEGEEEIPDKSGVGKEGEVEGQGVMELWEGEKGGKYRVLVEVGLAYALTKVLLPVRIVASVWATPWFAGVLMGVRRVAGGLRK